MQLTGPIGGLFKLPTQMYLHSRVEVPWRRRTGKLCVSVLQGNPGVASVAQTHSIMRKGVLQLSAHLCVEVCVAAPTDSTCCPGICPLYYYKTWALTLYYVVLCAMPAAATHLSRPYVNDSVNQSCQHSASAFVPASSPGLGPPFWPAPVGV